MKGIHVCKLAEEYQAICRNYGIFAESEQVGFQKYFFKQHLRNIYSCENKKIMSLEN
jgi:hypothetical protein